VKFKYIHLIKITEFKFCSHCGYEFKEEDKEHIKGFYYKLKCKQCENIVELEDY